ncbi:hypothetical protein RYX45_22595, partial [Alkalihalophilus pseudofirmus]
IIIIVVSETKLRDLHAKPTAVLTGHHQQESLCHHLPRHLKGEGHGQSAGVLVMVLIRVEKM